MSNIASLNQTVIINGVYYTASIQFDTPEDLQDFQQSDMAATAAKLQACVPLLQKPFKHAAQSEQLVLTESNIQIATQNLDIPKKLQRPVQELFATLKAAPVPLSSLEIAPLEAPAIPVNPAPLQHESFVQLQIAPLSTQEPKPKMYRDPRESVVAALTFTLKNLQNDPHYLITRFTELAQAANEQSLTPETKTFYLHFKDLLLHEIKPALNTKSGEEIFKSAQEIAKKRLDTLKHKATLHQQIANFYLAFRPTIEALNKIIELIFLYQAASNVPTLDALTPQERLLNPANLSFQQFQQHAEQRINELTETANKQIKDTIKLIY